MIISLLIAMVLLLYFGYRIGKNYFLSSEVKDLISDKISSSLNSEVEIEQTGMDLNNFYFIGTKISSDKYVIEIDTLKLTLNPHRIVKQGTDFSKWISDIVIAGCRVSYFSQSKSDSLSSLDIINDDLEKGYKKFLLSLKEYSFLKSIKFMNIEISSAGIDFIKKTDGVIFFLKDNLFKVKIDGCIGKNITRNIHLNGFADFNKYSSDFSLKIDKTLYSKGFNYKEYDLEEILLEGFLQFEYNKNRKNEFKLKGSANVAFDSLCYKNGKVFDKILLDCNILNNEISINKLSAENEMSRVLLSGKMFDIHDPKLNLKIEGENLIKSIEILLSEQNGFSKKLLKSLKNGISKTTIDINGDIFNPLINGDVVLKNFFFDDLKFDSTRININYKDQKISSFNISSTSGESNVSAIASGDIGSMEFTTDINCIGKVSDFYHNDMLNERIFGALSGDLSYKSGELEVNFVNDFYDFTISDEVGISIIGNYDDNRLSFITKDKEGKSGSFWLTMNDFDFSFETSRLSNIGNLLMKNFPLKIKNCAFELESLNDKIRAVLKANDEQDPLYGDYSVFFNSKVNSLYTGKVRLYNKKFFPVPVYSDLFLNKDVLLVENLNINNRPFEGSLSINLKSNVLDGYFAGLGLNLGELVDSETFSSNSDIIISIYGKNFDPEIDLSYYENRLTSTFDIADQHINGEIDLHYGSGNLSIDKVIMFNKSRLFGCYTGNISLDGDITLSGKSSINCKNLSTFFNIPFPEGTLDMNLNFKGSNWRPHDLSVDFSSTGLRMGEDYIEDFSAKISGDDINVFLDELKVKSENMFDLDLKGTFPYSLKDKINIEGNLSADLLKLADRHSGVLKNCTGVFKGPVKIGGTLLKPRLDYADLQMHDGRMEIDGIIPLLRDFKGGFHVRNDSIFIDRITAISDRDDVVVNLINEFGVNGFEDVIIPPGYNIGTASFIFEEGPITARIPGFMEENSWGKFNLTGYDNDHFYIGKRNGIFTLSGRGMISNVRMTYPMIDEHPGAPHSDNIFDYVWFDLEIVPSYGNVYFYNANQTEKNIFSRFLSSLSFSENRSLNRAKIPITPSNEGLKIIGMYMKKDTFKLSGKIEAEGGEVTYSALNFDLMEANLDFDRNKGMKRIDPYLSGMGKTVAMSRTDSLSAPEFEDVYIKIVTRDKGEIIDSEGAFISNFSIDITDEDGNPWFSQKDSPLLDIDTENTVNSMFNMAMDNKMFKTFLNPIESAVGELLGGYLTIRPSFTKNVLTKDKQQLKSYNYVAEYFVDSEIFFTKFITNSLSLNLKGKFIGEENSLSEIDRKFGYESLESIDFRFGRYITGSVGYLYDSLDEDGSYIYSLKFRYRFRNLEQVFNPLNKKMSKFLENF
ncbi:MAG: hypothetical protein JXR48_07230 [Candidatus Delongbacteria bacterium]|nr:hypothetical protein [Candidatus Delongbacteria bacterium]